MSVEEASQLKTQSIDNSVEQTGLGKGLPSIPSPLQGKSLPCNRASAWTLSPSPPKLQQSHSHGSLRSHGNQGNNSVLPCLLGPKFKTRGCSSLQSQLRQRWISLSQCPPALSRQTTTGFREDHTIEPYNVKGLEWTLNLI